MAVRRQRCHPTRRHCGRITAITEASLLIVEATLPHRTCDVTDSNWVPLTTS